MDNFDGFDIGPCWIRPANVRLISWDGCILQLSFLYESLLVEKYKGG